MRSTTHTTELDANLKAFLLCALAVLGVGSIAFSQDATGEPAITAGELSDRPVIGRLGVPLGTVTEIQAEIFAGRELRQKRYMSDYLLKVTHVAGKELARTRLLKFSVPRIADVNLAANPFDLYELRNGKRATGLDDAQIVRLEEGYVGKTVRLVVYETGGFSGIPRNMPEGVTSWADVSFSFSTSLVVLVERR